ncbi:hypothetical protein SCOR_15980 [Sulfidibacter corallicola]|uniref:Uncharacterized protein n=1 Tax=Sulfidibacter corallicola TaxID=2818388 RepID=A0A8A4U5L4_SULCO|nr:hypothetical protein [Sulfidibacter corallicola]QTD54035.1 hypothetical protein J3U87_16435 [Sulfidibacter corallicola]
MKPLVPMLLLIWSTQALAQTRMIPHITRGDGGFTTDIFLTNTSTTVKTLVLAGFDVDGQALAEHSASVEAGHVVDIDTSTIWGDDARLGYLTLSGAEEIRATASYRAVTSPASPAHTAESAEQATEWSLFAGDWSLVFDGVAVVNTGSASTQVHIERLDRDGTVRESATLPEALAPGAKALAVIGGPEVGLLQSPGEGLIRLRADQTLAVTALRGDLPGNRYLWTNPVTAMASRTTQSTTLALGSVPSGLPSAFDTFDKYVSVFGVHIFAVAGVPDAKALHAAHVMAEYLDNDEDGTIDDPAVLESMLARNAGLVMFAHRDDPAMDTFFDRVDSLDGWHLQDLQGDETLPNGAASGRFDATLEEVLHLINSAGHAEVYPEAFGISTESELAAAMDLARGGHFQQVPSSYPAGAWYTYDDVTCEYDCQLIEYLYWALTSLLGAQDFPGRLEEIQHEWRLNTADRLRAGDPAIYALLTDGRFVIPTILPDGDYRPAGGNGD